MDKKLKIFFGIFLIVFFVMVIVNQYGTYQGFMKKDFSNSKNFVNNYISENYYSINYPDPSADSSSRWDGFIKKYWRSSRKCRR